MGTPDSPMHLSVEAAHLDQLLSLSQNKVWPESNLLLYNILGSAFAGPFGMASLQQGRCYRQSTPAPARTAADAPEIDRAKMSQGQNFLQGNCRDHVGSI